MTSSVTRANIADGQQDCYESRRGSCVRTLQRTFRDGGHEAIYSIAAALTQAWLINVTFPDIRGFERYEMLRQCNPDARYLLVSDQYDVNQVRQAGERGVVYLSKPPKRWWLDPMQGSSLNIRDIHCAELSSN